MPLNIWEETVVEKLLIDMGYVNSFVMQMESIMIKGHKKVRKCTKKRIGVLPHNKRCIVMK